LHDCRKVELIAGAGETSQSHALAAQMMAAILDTDFHRQSGMESAD
jgi:hypothetical protein